MRTRYTSDGSRAAAVVLGLVTGKLRRLQASTGNLQLTAEQLLQHQEELREVLTGMFHAAVVPLQVAPVLLWLWWQLGPWTLLLLGAGVPLLLPSRRNNVPAFLAYETASRRRWEILTVKHVDSEALLRAKGLRKEALEALQLIHSESHRLAICLGRWPQLVALAVLVASARWLPREVLFVVFLQCQYLLRQLSILKILKSPKLAAFGHLEAVLQQEEVAHVEEVEGCYLEMKGCFAWSDASEPCPLPCLCNIELQVQPGDFLAICGTAGAGKTSLLRAACGCLTPLKGARLRRSSSSIFLPSEPWLLPGTLQQNVLAERSLDVERYEEVLKACGLPAEVPDLEHCGDALRRRIALARAAYGREALVLMDDPFAGFSNEEVDELFEIFSSRLFAARSLVVTFGGSAPQRALRRGRQGRPRFLVMEAGNLQAVQELPEFLNNEARDAASGVALDGNVGRRGAPAGPEVGGGEPQLVAGLMLGPVLPDPSGLVGHFFGLDIVDTVDAVDAQSDRS